MAISISISSPLPLFTTKPLPNSSSFSSSNSLFFCNHNSRPFVGSLQRSTTLIHYNNGRSLSCTCLFGLGVPELVVIAGVAALVFGPKNLPGIGKNIGKTVKSFQQAAKEFESELKKEPETDGETPSQEVKGQR